MRRRLFLQGDIPMNWYFIVHNQQCYIVDPGYQKERIQQYVANEHWEVLGILLTHAHIDHIEALDCFQVPIYVHELEYDILMNDELNGFSFFNKKRAYNIQDMDIRTITEHTTIPIGNKTISVIHTPGHTQGGVCYRLDHNLYVGDTIFEGSVGRWDRPTANLQQLQQSVFYLLEQLPEHLLIHPGHGDSSTIGIEKIHNPYYIQWKMAAKAFKTESLLQK